MRGSPPSARCLLSWLTSDFRSSASTCMVRNLRIRNGFSPFPIRTCLKKTGPRESSLIANATARRSGERTSSPSADAVMSSVRLSMTAERESRRGGRPIIGTPSVWWMLTFAPITSNSLGTMSIWTSRPLSDRTTSICCSWESFENAITTRSTWSADAMSTRSSGDPRIGEVTEPGSALLRLGVDEPDEVEAVLGVMANLLPDELTDLAGADDQRVLQVRRPSGGRGRVRPPETT